MTEKEPFEQLITADEALDLFRFSSIQEIYIATELYNVYNARIKTTDRKWYIQCLLAFVYDTGRVQGIREARKRSKAV